MLSSGMTHVRVKNVLGDDVYGLWHVKKIVVQKGGQRYAIIPRKEAFNTKDDAVHYAQLKTRRFIERNLREISTRSIRLRSVTKYVCAAAVMPLMVIGAVRWLRG